MDLQNSIRFIDLSHRLGEGTLPFPGDPALGITVLDATREEEGKPVGVNNSAISMSLHCGTHMDAPFHFAGDQVTIDRVPLEQCCGAAVLLRLPGAGRNGVIDVEHLTPVEAQLGRARRVVLNTGWHRLWGSPDYFTGHPVVALDAARFLVETGVYLVGADFPSVDHPPHESHRLLLGSGAVILENLTNLDAITGDIFQLFALPLRIEGRDGSPVRAVAMLK